MLILAVKSGLCPSTHKAELPCSSAVMRTALKEPW